MISRIRKRASSLCLLTIAIGSCMALLSASAGAEDSAQAAFAEGDRIDAFTLETQHGEAASVDESTRIVLFSRDMEGGDLLKEALTAVEGSVLDRSGVVYVSDISGMPGLVAKLFAVPAMRRRPYSLLLDRDGTVTARLPDEAGRATLIHLENLRIERIEYAPDAATIRASLGLEPATP